MLAIKYEEIGIIEHDMMQIQNFGNYNPIKIIQNHRILEVLHRSASIAPLDHHHQNWHLHHQN